MTTSEDAALIEQIHTLQEGTAYRRCPELGAVYVRGDDRVSWLNGQLTNDVRAIAAGESVQALAVNVRGKIMAELNVADLGDALLLLVHRSAQAALLESFERYIIMEDVSLEPTPEQSVVYVDGPLPATLALDLDRQLDSAAHGSLASFAYAPLGRPGRVWIGGASRVEQLAATFAAALPEIDEAASELIRLRRALPRYGVDYDAQNYPQEVGLKALVSFKKGCYLGQEVVCTLENRGKLSRHLCALRGAPSVHLRDIVPITAQDAATRTPLHAAADAAGAEAAGWITSAAWDPEQGHCHLLAYVRRNHAVPGATLFAGSQALTLVKLVGEDSLQPSAT